MPAYPTHTFFSHLALQALLDAGHPLAAAAARHEALFRIAGIAGADIQCMPYQVCGHCAAPYRHDQKLSRTCLVCHRAALKDFSFKVSDGRRLTRVDIERDLYANTHLVLHRKYHGYGVPPSTPAGLAEQPFPEQVIRHLANCLRDAQKMGGQRAGNYLAFILGWFSHVVSDALFKGVYLHAVKVDFFGQHYGPKMLPAAETLTMTDISHDFGVHWPTWHAELETAESDGGALKHLAMGNPPERYDSRYWTPEFGRPDPAIGRVLEAVPPLNRKWFRRMYVQPDYTAPSPRLDVAPLSTRASWRFGETRMDLGQLRRYALPTGWYGAFLQGVKIYLRAVQEATQQAGLSGPAVAPTDRAVSRPGVPSWSLWASIVGGSIRSGEAREPDWGSRLQIDPDAVAWLDELRAHPVRIIPGQACSEYQQALAEILRRRRMLRMKTGAARAIVIGPPAFNPAACALLCTEDALRLKYDQGLAGVVRLSPDRTQLLLAGFSDFGDDRLVDWLLSNAGPNGR